MPDSTSQDRNDDCRDCGHPRSRHANASGRCGWESRAGCACTLYRNEQVTGLTAGPCALCPHPRHLHRDAPCQELSCRCGHREEDLPPWERQDPWV